MFWPFTFVEGLALPDTFSVLSCFLDSLNVPEALGEGECSEILEFLVGAEDGVQQVGIGRSLVEDDTVQDLQPTARS